jgi:hypothetical protein
MGLPVDLYHINRGVHRGLLQIQSECTICQREGAKAIVFLLCFHPKCLLNQKRGHGETQITFFGLRGLYKVSLLKIVSRSGVETGSQRGHVKMRAIGARAA